VSSPVLARIFLHASVLAALAAPALAATTVVDTGQAQCCSSIQPEFPPATYYGATMLRNGDPLGAWRPHQAVMPDPPAEIEILLGQVDTVEGQDGAMSPVLIEPLRGLAAAQLAGGRVTDAISTLRRSIHLARLNDGLHTPQQVEMLEQLISAYVSMGDFVAADRQQQYLYRVQSYGRSVDNPQKSEATLRYADWMRGAYLGDLGQRRFPRLVGLNDLFENAIEELEETQGENSRELLPYLQRRAELSYLISVYPGEQESGFRAEARPPGNFELADEAQLRFWRMRDHNFRYGLDALRRRETILLNNDDATGEELASAHIAIADWYQWNRRYASAVRYYEEAWALTDDTAWLEKTFQEPLELPRDIVFNPGVMPIGTLNEAEVVLRFDVSRHGEAKEITILSEESRETQSGITRAYHYLRNMRFRPKLSGGQVVRAEDVERTYQVKY